MKDILELLGKLEDPQSSVGPARMARMGSKALGVASAHPRLIGATKRASDAAFLWRQVDVGALRAEVREAVDSKLGLVGLECAGVTTLRTLLLNGASNGAADFGTARELDRDTSGSIVTRTLRDPIAGRLASAGAEPVRGELESVLDCRAVVLVLDASRGIRSEEFALLRWLQILGRRPFVVLNKADLLASDARIALVREARALLAVEPLPVSAKTGADVGAVLARIIDQDLVLGIALARTMPRFRARVCHRLTRAAAVSSMLLGADFVPGSSAGDLLAAQLRLVLQLAAVHGEPLTAPRASQLLYAAAAGYLVSGGARRAVRPWPAAISVGGPIGAAVGTMSIGTVVNHLLEKRGQRDGAVVRS